ncbi:NAD-dependent epimerase/dehydratase family protein [Nisaea sediminum]|uniref:NAD-dependent epimerase/dehydratase family protein n=1 Tax=Nisaea sediminum TaxID=2775867 RepID=UPI001D02CF28|nr:NAD-dependent epimerase/dehydratase family protein [Nisaea sediminum]
MSKIKSVVLGGSGFLGSHVAEHLCLNDHAVTVFDRRAPETALPGLETVIGDITDLSALCDAVSDADYVFNFAAIADIGDALARPVDAASVNIMGTVNALEASRRAGIKRFVQASSVYVFSESGGIYRATKLASEKLVETYQEHYGLDFSILRYGSLYGRRADKNNSIRRMVRQALQEQQIVYRGSENAVREYIHVSDAARLTIEILSDAYRNQHVVMAGHERMPIRDVMTMIKEMLAPSLDVELKFETVEGHYVVTPFNFSPKVGRKLTSHHYVDIGQGILDCLNEAYGELHGGTEAELSVQPHDDD